MAAAAELAIKLTTDARQAQTDLRGAASAVDDVGGAARAASGKLDSAESAMRGVADAADRAGRASRDVAGGIDTAGGASGKAATGIRDMMGALEGTRFEAFGAAVSQSAVYMEVAAGAGDLFGAAQEFLSLANLKAMASTVRNTAATVAGTIASKAASVASKAWAVAQAALNVVLSANPIGIIIIAIIALVAAIVLAYKNSETFRNIVQAVFRAALTAIKAVVDFVVRALTPIWRAVQVAVKVAIDLVMGYFRLWIAVISTVVGWIRDTLTGAFNTLKSTATTVLNALLTPFRAVRDAVGWVIDKVEDLIGWIARIQLPDIGGFIDAINPFSAAAPASATTAVAGSRSGLAGGRPAGRVASGRGGIVVNLSVPATANPVETGRQIVAMIRRFERAAGAGWRG